MYRLAAGCSSGLATLPYRRSFPQWRHIWNAHTTRLYPNLSWVTLCYVFGGNWFRLVVEMTCKLKSILFGWFTGLPTWFMTANKQQKPKKKNREICSKGKILYICLLPARIMQCLRFCEFMYVTYTTTFTLSFVVLMLISATLTIFRLYWNT